MKFIILTVICIDIHKIKELSPKEITKDKLILIKRKIVAESIIKTIITEIKEEVIFISDLILI